MSIIANALEEERDLEQANKSKMDRQIAQSKAQGQQDAPVSLLHGSNPGMTKITTPG